MSDCRYIFIKGAKAKNLKNIDIDILRSKRKEFFAFITKAADNSFLFTILNSYT